MHSEYMMIMSSSSATSDELELELMVQQEGPCLRLWHSKTHCQRYQYVPRQLALPAIYKVIKQEIIVIIIIIPGDCKAGEGARDMEGAQCWQPPSPAAEY